MTEIADPAFGTAPGRTTAQAVYAFDTDSMRGLALAVDLLDQGFRVSRGRDAFDAAGKHFETGAALVDGATLANGNAIAPTQRDTIIRLASQRQTPVSGLAGYPVARYAMDRPKIGLFTGVATEPNNPLRPALGSSYPGHCGVGGNTVYCQALFTLTQKMGLPASMVLPITTTDLAAGRLVTDGFTALINPSSTVAAGAGATALQAFVNQGGRYVGQLVGGTASARNAGLTTLNTRTVADLFTPGSFFTAAFDTANPVAWGFDNGGFLYRERAGAALQPPVFDPATLGGGGGIPAAAAPVRYSDPLRSFGYTLNALGAGQLPGTPAIVDQPFGAGRSILVGFDAFFRAWRDSDERLILNAVLYPDAAVIPAPAGAGAGAQAAPAAGTPVLPGQSAAGRPAAPVAKAKLTTVRKRPLKVVDRTAADVRIRVARKDGAKLRQAVKAARLPRAIRRKAGWVTTRRTVTFVVRNARRSFDEHDRRAWTGKILSPLKKRGVRILLGQL
jgi:hypothetical protein